MPRGVKSSGEGGCVGGRAALVAARTRRGGRYSRWAEVTRVVMYSIEVRLVALAMLRNGVPRHVIYENIGVKRSTLKRWASYYRDQGSPWRDPVHRNLQSSSCWFDNRLMLALVTLVRDNPRALLREHAAMLAAMRDHPSGEFVGLRCSKSTVDLHMRRLGFTRKVVLRLFRESLDAVRREHAVARARIPRRCIVSVDETHTDGGDVFRRYGRALTNERSRERGRDPRSVPRTSTTMAISPDGRILGFQSVIVRDGGLKAADWRLFLQLLMPKLGVYVPGRPWRLQASNCVVLFDNAPIHNHVGDTFLGSNGVPFFCLPAYSPDRQPIEGVFNDLKVIIRNLVYVQPDLLDDPHLLQARAASFITRRQVIGQYDRVDKVLESILV